MEDPFPGKALLSNSHDLLISQVFFSPHFANLFTVKMLTRRSSSFKNRQAIMTQLWL
jgi:hypothetical protein